MKFYLIADTHFGHKRATEFGRPKNFEQVILANLKKMTKPGDAIVHLGDFAFGSDVKWMREFVKATKGRKRILVKGNHDQKSLSWYVDQGFDFACDGFSMKYGGQTILFTHIPDNYSPWEYTMNIHGHLHDNKHRAGEYPFVGQGELTHKLVSMEWQKCEPVELQKFIHTPMLLTN